jgi:hypothetical protein
LRFWGCALTSSVSAGVYQQKPRCQCSRTYEDAEKKIHATNLNIRLLATRHDPTVQPGLIIDQSPAPGEEVAVGYLRGVRSAKRISPALAHKGKAAGLNQISHTLRSWRITTFLSLNRRDTTNRLRGTAGGFHIITFSEVANMKNVFSLRKRSFLSPVW